MEIKNFEKFRIGGFATGDYLINCRVCHSYFIGDKRAFLCLDCVIKDYEHLQEENKYLKKINSLLETKNETKKGE